MEYYSNHAIIKMAANYFKLIKVIGVGLYSEWSQIIRKGVSLKNNSTAMLSMEVPKRNYFQEKPNKECTGKGRILEIIYYIHCKAQIFIP